MARKDVGQMRSGLTGKSIIVQDGNYQRCVDLEDILYISIIRHGCEVHLSGEVERTMKIGKRGLVLKKSLSEVYDQLGQYDFEYAHSSYIVNLWHVASIDEREEVLLLKTGEELKISRSRKAGLEQALIRIQEREREGRKKREQDYYKLDELHQRYSETLRELEKDVRDIHKLVEQFDEVHQTLEELGVTVENSGGHRYTKYHRINMILAEYREMAAERAIPMEVEASEHFLLPVEMQHAAVILLDSLLEYALESTAQCPQPHIIVWMGMEKKRQCARIGVENNYDGEFIMESFSEVRKKADAYPGCLELDCRGNKFRASLYFSSEKS